MSHQTVNLDLIEVCCLDVDSRGIAGIFRLMHLFVPNESEKGLNLVNWFLETSYHRNFLKT